MIIALPYPISANVYWRSRAVKGVCMTYISTEAKAYKNEVAWLCKAAGIRSPILGRVAVDIKLYPHRPKDWEKRMKKDPNGWDDTVRSIDLDNANKVLLDALKNIAFEDDRKVYRLSSERMQPDGEARVVVTVTAIEKPADLFGSNLDIQNIKLPVSRMDMGGDPF